MSLLLHIFEHKVLAENWLTRRFNRLAYQNGIVPDAGDYIILVIAATVGSMGAVRLCTLGVLFLCFVILSAKTLHLHLS